MADGSVSYRVSPQIRQFYGPWGATESLTIGTGGVIASATGSYFFLDVALTAFPQLSQHL